MSPDRCGNGRRCKSDPTQIGFFQTPVLDARFFWKVGWDTYNDEKDFADRGVMAIIRPRG
jgi:hypothetical protein